MRAVFLSDIIHSSTRVRPKELQILWALLQAGSCSTQALIDALYGRDPEGGPDCPKRLILIYIWGLRQKLAPPWHIHCYSGAYHLSDGPPALKPKLPRIPIPRNHVTPEERETIIQMRRLGHTHGEIRMRTGRNSTTVGRVLRKAGIVTPAATRERLEEHRSNLKHHSHVTLSLKQGTARDMIEQGYSPIWIAKETGLTENHIRKLQQELAA